MAVWPIFRLGVNEDCKSDSLCAQMSSYPHRRQRRVGKVLLSWSWLPQWPAVTTSRGLSKTEIADEYRLSRFKIARLLETARSQGLVRIEISHPGTIDVELSVCFGKPSGLNMPLWWTPRKTMLHRCASSSAWRPPTCWLRS